MILKIITYNFQKEGYNKIKHKLLKEKRSRQFFISKHIIHMYIIILIFQIQICRSILFPIIFSRYLQKPDTKKRIQKRYSIISFWNYSIMIFIIHICIFYEPL